MNPDATERLALLLPPGPELDEMVCLIRLGVQFRSQQAGRRPGALTRYLVNLVRGFGPACTFEQLLDCLEREAALHNIDTGAAGTISVENVNRVMEVVIFHDPRKGADEVPFGTLRNRLTATKKILRDEITSSDKP